jgi:small subunit ribosomal protein S1
MDAYKPGTVVEEATVLSMAEFGIFVRIAEGIEGLVPSGEIPANAEIAVGAKVRAEISNVDSVDRRITLTMRNPGESPEADQVQALKRESSGKGATLGDVFKSKLESLKKTPSVPPPAATPAADDEE